MYKNGHANGIQILYDVIMDFSDFICSAKDISWFSLTNVAQAHELGSELLISTGSTRANLVETVWEIWVKKVNTGGS